MAKNNPNREKAFEIYKSNKGTITVVEISKMLDENQSTVRSWKKKDLWDDNLPKRGAPRGNKNAKGNKGGKGAPRGNINSVKHGLYMSDESFVDKMKNILPKSLLNTMNVLSDETPLDKLYRNIMILDAKIANSHKIFNVKSKSDHTVIRKKKYLDSNSDEIEEFEVQTAQDKEATYGNTLSSMKKTLSSMIKNYLELLDQQNGLAREEKLLKIEKLKYEVNSLKIDESEDNEITIVVDYGDEDE